MMEWRAGASVGRGVAAKRPGFRPLVKKTYLTIMYLTRVSTNVCGGFAPKINLFRENVQIRTFVLKWANEHTLLLHMEGPGEIHFTTKRTKGTKG
jgi:hypothetical protein